MTRGMKSVNRQFRRCLKLSCNSSHGENLWRIALENAKEKGRG